MEIPSLGVNCSVDGCNRLDFLPLRCECGKMFCTDHFMEHTQGCEVFKKSKAVKMQVAEVAKTSYACTFEGCSEVSSFHFPCKKCAKHYCISHRHHKLCDISEEELEEERKRWNLPIEQYNKAKEKLETYLNKTALKVQPDSKKSKMSNKIQLMRLKGKAIGQQDIPMQDRLYFLVYKPMGSNAKEVADKINDTITSVVEGKIEHKPVAVYISKNWSIGKMIDSFSQFCKVINNNNKTNESKLRLFRLVDGLIVSSIMSMKINKVIENNVIRDGESLILEYVDGEKCTTDDCHLQNYVVYAE